MSDNLSLTNGEHVDLSTHLGCREYIAKYLKENGASSIIFSCLERIGKVEKTEIFPKYLEGKVCEWGPCLFCRETILKKSMYCQGCGREVYRFSS